MSIRPTYFAGACVLPLLQRERWNHGYWGLRPSAEQARLRDAVHPVDRREQGTLCEGDYPASPGVRQFVLHV